MVFAVAFLLGASLIWVYVCADYRCSWLMFQTDCWWLCSLSWNSGQKQCGVWGCRISSCKRFVCYPFNAFNASTVSWSYEMLGLRRLGSTLTQCQDLSGSWKKRLEIFSWSRVETLAGGNFSDIIILPFFTSENTDSQKLWIHVRVAPKPARLWLSSDVPLESVPWLRIEKWHGNACWACWQVIHARSYWRIMTAPAYNSKL